MMDAPTRETYLATIKYAPFLPGKGPRWVLHTWDGEHYDRGKWAIGYRLIQIEPNGERSTVYQSSADGFLYQPPRASIDSREMIADAQASIFAFYSVRMDAGEYHEPEYSEYMSLAESDIRQVFLGPVHEETPEIFRADDRTAIVWSEGEKGGAWYALTPYSGGYLDWGLEIKRLEWRRGGPEWVTLYDSPHALTGDCYGYDDGPDGYESEGIEWAPEYWREVMQNEGDDLISTFVGDE